MRAREKGECKMKKSMIFAVVAGAMAAAGAAFGALQGGGVEGDPYLIGSCAELQEFAQGVDGTHAAIAQNPNAWAVATDDITTTETKLKGDSTFQHERTEP